MKTTNKTTLQKTLGKRSFGKVGMILGGVLFLIGAMAEADTFGTGENGFTLDFVPIGNAGNGNDAGAGGGSYSTPYGGVAYDYRMGVNEISQTAINAAVAGGLTGMPAGSWSGNQPSASINWYQAAAFTNWLNTSTGHVAAYQLNAGLTELTLWSSGEAWQVGGENLYRNKDAYYFLTSENEWYKAAYQKNDGVTPNYWDYPTASNSAPTAVGSGTGAGTAVYNNSFGSGPASVYNDGGLSAYGTMGQGGNVYEWMETALDGINNSSSESRGVRGGYWSNTESFLRSSYRLSHAPTSSYVTVGFRVASVPEPSAAVLMISAGMLALARRRTRAAL